MRSPEAIAYCNERDTALMTGVDALIAFVRKHGKEFPSPHVAEIALHQMRTAVLSLPPEMRAASYRWLVERGYETLDDGELRL
jgi:hypothetical protein